MSVTWSVQNISNPNNTSSYSYNSNMTSFFYLTCHEVGGYTLRSDFKFNGVNVSFSDMVVVATPF